MARPMVRRTSDPKTTRRIHSAILKTIDQKQSPIFERIFRALTIDKLQITRSRIELQLKNSVRDGLIADISNASNHGKTKGEMKNTYRIPSVELFYQVHSIKDFRMYPSSSSQDLNSSKT